MIRAISVFDYTDYRSFVSSFFKEKKNDNPNFSLRLWAPKLGLKGPSALSMVLNGQRHPGSELTDQFVEFFRFSSQQAKYFRLLVRLAKVNGDEKKRIELLKELQKIHPKNNFYLLDGDMFDSISNWYFFAIRELVQLEDFKEDYSWISKRLNKAISPQEAKRAITVMLRLGLLKQGTNKKLVQADNQITTTSDIGSEALKQFHEEMITLARQSIRTVPVYEREITSVTLNISPIKMKEAKELIREFRIRFTDLIEESPGKETYQLNVQFFPLTNLKNGGMKNEKNE